MSSGSTGGASGGKQVRESTTDGATGSVPVDPALLARVLQQTLAAADEKDAANSADLQRLRAIAHRRKGQNLVLEPVVIEMVRGVLGAEFAGLDKDPERFNEITMRIARSLLDDPVANKRLENLWARLADL
jgi:hypothetical protein